jgi:thiamine biosynthesis lipoprotein
LAAAVVAVPFTAIAACAPTASARRAQFVTEARVAMGSELRLTAWTRDEAAARAAFEQVFAEFNRLDALMSVWRAGSDVLRLNRAAGGAPVAVSPEVVDVLELARQISEWTGGKFDVSFGALAGLWKFDHDQDGRVPGAREIRARLPLVAYEAIEVHARASTARLARPGMRIHLGGIGKGYAVDRGAELLRHRGLTDFLIQSGGDSYAAGRPEGRRWRLGIRDPRGSEDESFAFMELTDAAFSTSGDYERFFIHQGRRYHHILDPDRGEPAAASRSVTIVANRAVIADALSTGVFILGPQRGMALIERLPNVEGIIVSATNDVLVSSGLAPHIAFRSPTDAP